MNCKWNDTYVSRLLRIDCNLKSIKIWKNGSEITIENSVKNYDFYIKKKEANRAFNWSWCCSRYESSGWLIGWYIVLLQLWTIIFKHWINEGQNQCVVLFSFQMICIIILRTCQCWKGGNAVASGKWNLIWYFEETDKKDGKNFNRRYDFWPAYDCALQKRINIFLFKLHLIFELWSNFVVFAIAYCIQHVCYPISKW